MAGQRLSCNIFFSMSRCYWPQIYNAHCFIRIWARHSYKTYRGTVLKQRKSFYLFILAQLNILESGFYILLLRDVIFISKIIPQWSTLSREWEFWKDSCGNKINFKCINLWLWLIFGLIVYESVCRFAGVCMSFLYLCVICVRCIVVFSG